MDLIIYNFCNYRTRSNDDCSRTSYRTASQHPFSSQQIYSQHLCPTLGLFLFDTQQSWPNECWIEIEHLIVDIYMT